MNSILGRQAGHPPHHHYQSTTTTTTACSIIPQHTPPPFSTNIGPRTTPSAWSTSSDAQREPSRHGRRHRCRSATPKSKGHQTSHLHPPSFTHRRTATTTTTRSRRRISPRHSRSSHSHPPRSPQSSPRWRPRPTTTTPKPITISRHRPPQLLIICPHRQSPQTIFQRSIRPFQSPRLDATSPQPQQTPARLSRPIPRSVDHSDYHRRPTSLIHLPQPFTRFHRRKVEISHI